MVKKTIYLWYIGFFLWFIPQSSRAETSWEQVVPIADKQWKRSVPKDRFAREICYLLRMNNKYVLNTWYRDLKGFSKQQGEYFDFGGRTEHFIRPVAHNVFTLAVCFRLRVYDPEITGISETDAMNMTQKLIRSVAYRHLANSGKGGWGRQWQSALWAAQIAEAAWFLWDDLPSGTRELVCRMMVDEADRFLDYKVPYYRDAQGKELTKGDTKAEENAWNSNILTIAMAMMPNHAHYQAWMQKNIELQISAYAAPDDLTRKDRVDGFVLNQILKGSNLNPDGTVTNHQRIHPDYMVAIMHNATNVWLYRLANQKELEASLFNGQRVYYALTDQLFQGKTMYQPTEKGKASPFLFFPEGNDWGEGRQANYWLMDVMAHLFGWDKKSTVKAIAWAKVRNKKMIEMISRDTTGQYYQAKSEDRFASREEWFGSHIAWGYLGWWLK